MNVYVIIGIILFWIANGMYCVISEFLDRKNYNMSITIGCIAVWCFYIVIGPFLTIMAFLMWLEDRSFWNINLFSFKKRY